MEQVLAKLLRGHLVGGNLAWENDFNVRLPYLVWKRKERDGKKICGSYAYFSEREGKTNTMDGWYLINSQVVVIHIWQKYPQ